MSATRENPSPPAAREPGGTPDIAIVGAGIGGLTAALALARAGLRVRVYEQAETLGEVGAGLSITPNAAKGLRYVGLGDALHAAADVPPLQATCHWQTGAVLIALDRAANPDQYGAPYYQVHRADLHALLVRALVAVDADAVVTGHALEDIAETAGAVSLHFRDGTRATAAAVIGADGLKSTVRAKLLGGDAPTFSGFVAWRGLVPRERLAGLDPAPGSRVWIGQGQIFVRYPVRHGALMNYVAFAQTSRWERESWSQAGSVDEPLALFRDWYHEVPAILEATPDRRCHKWGLFAREPLGACVTRRVALLGDAAHPMLPWFAQGAGSAIEDAVILARCVAAGGSLPDAFQRYQAARHERVGMLFRESLLGGERLAAARPEHFRPETVRNEDSLGIFAFDPVTAPV